MDILIGIFLGLIAGVVGTHVWFARCDNDPEYVEFLAAFQDLRDEADSLTDAVQDIYSSVHVRGDDRVTVACAHDQALEVEKAIHKVDVYLND
jgi:hypothetical protein